MDGNCIELLKQTIVQHFRETGDNPLEMLVKAEAIIQLLDGIRADLKEDVVDILSSHPQGKAEVLGAEVTSLTYSNAINERKALIDFSLKNILIPIEQRLSQPDFQPSPYRMGNTLMARVRGLIADYLHPGGLVG